ncbi:MAG TPA: hypothetical protein DCZ92_06325 [Elusimicrobia bacterium]|nr:MAG: hypothetical protein A2016_06340 [Elusimicrobia bacterium GWF2_62_30]HBA60422.1 hypothetical protein [Elusimicrobiota bacterium]
MRETKTEAKTIQDAVEKGLAEMGLRRDQVEVVVVTEGTSGFLGFGAKKACVILREKRWASGTGSEEPRGRGPRRDGRGGGPRRDGRGAGPRREGGPRRESRSASAPRRPGRYGYEDARLPPAASTEEQQQQPRPERGPRREGGYQGGSRDRVYKEEPLAADFMSIQPAQDPVEHAKAALLKITSLMGMETTVTEARLESAENLIFIRFECADHTAFTEENGRGLQSLQFVVNSIVSRKREPHPALRLDTGGYWDKKEKELARLVEDAVNSVKSTAAPFRLDPMPASMRKMVHNMVKTSYPGMETTSEGEGRWRKVVIRQTETAQTGTVQTETAQAEAVQAEAVRTETAQAVAAPAAEAAPEQAPAVEQTVETQPTEQK